MDLTRLSRAVSHALRHEPWLYELEFDASGWASVDALLKALRTDTPAWSKLTQADLVEMIARSNKKRYELCDDRIRALYGHSTPHKLLKEAAAPPPSLFHGTSREAADRIRTDGLRPMGRQYVHLSLDTSTAAQVGRRKAKSPIILHVDAQRAYAQGIAFYRGNEIVWLADGIPSTFIA